MNSKDKCRISAVILVGGPTQGTRFRPLSLHIPKPLFKIGGKEMIYHHCKALSEFGPDFDTIYILGSFEASTFESFINDTSTSLGVKIEYIKEPDQLGTAGGLYYFHNKFATSDVVFVLHSDISCTFPLKEMLNFHLAHGHQATMLGTEIPKESSSDYGCYVKDKDSNKVIHYVEKPKTYVSDTINAGIYCFNSSFFNGSPQRLYSRDNLCESRELHLHEANISMELDVIPQLILQENLYIYESDQFWRSVKDAGAAVFCNEQYMLFYSETKPEILSKGPNIIGHVIIDPSAIVDITSKIGPNVYIGPNSVIGKGVRVHNSILMEDVHINDHSCIMYTIVGANSHIGKWTRIEGDKKTSLHNSSQKNGIAILGQNVTVNNGIIIRNCIVMPHKSLTSSQFDEILL